MQKKMKNASLICTMHFMKFQKKSEQGHLFQLPSVQQSRVPSHENFHIPLIVNTSYKKNFGYIKRPHGQMAV